MLIKEELKEHLKEEVRRERQKLKEMSLSDKIWYIWEYYKFHIIGVFLVILVISIVATSVHNASIDPGIYCVVINNRSSQELDTSVLEQDFYEHMGFGEKQPVYAESMFITYGDQATEYSYAAMAKLSALIASKDLDIIIGDRENIDHYTSMDGLADLEQFLPQDVLAAAEDRLIYAADSSGQSVATSIDISGTWLAERMHLSQESSSLSIVSNLRHTDNAIALIRYIFDL